MLIRLYDLFPNCFLGEVATRTVCCSGTPINYALDFRMNEVSGYPAYHRLSYRTLKLAFPM